MRSIAVSVSLALISVVGCSVEDPPADQDPSEIEPQAPERLMLPPIGARVLVREDRGLALEPKRGATRVFASGDGLRIAEVVAHVGDFVELRTVAGQPTDACTAGGVDPSFELHFFARPQEFDRVLGQPKRFEFDDGTRLEFAAGVPIVGGASDPALRVGAAEFAVPLAVDEIASWFVAAPVEQTPGRIRWPAGRPLHYGEHHITGTADPPFVTANEAEPIDGGSLLTFANACGRFTLRTDVEVPNSKAGLYAMKGPQNAIPKMARNFDPDMMARNAGILGVLRAQDGQFLASPYGDGEDVWGELCEPSVRWTASVDAQLRWQETGTWAGVVIHDITLPDGASERDGKVCFAATGLDVCIATAQLQREQVECNYEKLGLIDEGFGGRGKPVPQVQLAKPKVGPGLDKELVRRIIRAHINEVRSCYNAGLGEHPKLAGRVTIAFEVAANGMVISSAVEQDTLEPADEAVSECIAEAVGRWTFPRPKDGVTVRVVCPFDLASGQFMEINMENNR